MSPRTRSSAASARRITTSALLAALLVVSALFTGPMRPVPFTLQVLVIVLIALVVPPRWAALSVGTYLALGAAGLPVFSGQTGGLAVVVGPTGGYLLGFLAGAVAGAWLRERASRLAVPRLGVDVAVAVVVIGIVYALGWAQLTLVTHMGAVAALLSGVVPFLVPDGIKAAVAVALAPMVRRALRS
jgi:biotin transport system substrate-specific component